jgi:hypothetical protein
VEIRNSYPILSRIAMRVLYPMWPHPSVLVPWLGTALTSRVSFRSSYELFFQNLLMTVQVNTSSAHYLDEVYVYC